MTTAQIFLVATAAATRSRTNVAEMLRADVLATRTPSVQSASIVTERTNATIAVVNLMLGRQKTAQTRLTTTAAAMRF